MDIYGRVTVNMFCVMKDPDDLKARYKYIYNISLLALNGIKKTYRVCVCFCLDKVNKNE